MTPEELKAALKEFYEGEVPHVWKHPTKGWWDASRERFTTDRAKATAYPLYRAKLILCIGPGEWEPK